MIVGERAARDQLILHNMWVAGAVAAKYRRHGVLVEDLLQEAAIALGRAADTFDPARGRLSTVATVCIRRHLAEVFPRLANLVSGVDATLMDSLDAQAFDDGESWLDRQVDDTPSVEQVLVDRATIQLQQQAVTQLVSKLEPAARDLVVDYHIHGATFAEIGAKLGMTKQGVSRRYGLAMEHLGVLARSSRNRRLAIEALAA